MLFGYFSLLLIPAACNGPVYRWSHDVSDYLHVDGSNLNVDNCQGTFLELLSFYTFGYTQSEKQNNSSVTERIFTKM